MDSPLSNSIFSLDPGSTETRPAFERLYLRDAPTALQNEKWLQKAIIADPELVIGPCRQAGLTDDQWYCWAKEYPTGGGPCDILLVSSEGRVALVEVKTSLNRHIRRRVLAQLLDYMAHLPESLMSSRLELPKDGGEPVADIDEVMDSVHDGDVLLIIATDEADPRLARLTRGLTGDNLARAWDLAVVDMALFRSKDDPEQLLIVPCMRNVVVAEPRQFVKISIEGETPRAKVELERIHRSEPVSDSQWTVDSFFEYLEAVAPPSVVRLASAMRGLSEDDRVEPITLSFGRAKFGSVSVQRRGSSLLVIFGSGGVRVYRHGLTAALGENLGKYYIQRVEQLVPDRVRKMAYLRLQADLASKVADELRAIVEEVVDRADQADTVDDGL